MKILVLVMLLFAMLLLVATNACTPGDKDDVHGGQEKVSQEDIDQLGQDIDSLDVEDLGGLEE